MKILIDADACPKPVLQICKKAGRKYGVEVWTVASFNHSIDSDHPIVVSDDPQEVDIKVINMTEKGDIVITQDWGLAAVVLGKGARCLSPAGKEFQPNRIEFLLEEREIKNRLRRMGGRTKGPKKRTIKDDQRFVAALEKILKLFLPIVSTDRTDGRPI